MPRGAACERDVVRQHRLSDTVVMVAGPCQNILRARYREGDEAPVLMNPGEVYKFVIEMYPISNLFKAGHRIRMTVSSSSFPKWLPNGNTGREMDEDMPVIIAENTIYHDAERPSKVILPIIPAGAGAGPGRH